MISLRVKSRMLYWVGLRGETYLPYLSRFVVGSCDGIVDGGGVCGGWIGIRVILLGYRLGSGGVVGRMMDGRGWKRGYGCFDWGWG